MIHRFKASACFRPGFPDASPEGYTWRFFFLAKLLFFQNNFSRCFPFPLNRYVMSAVFTWRGLMDAELRHILWWNAHTQILTEPPLAYPPFNNNLLKCTTRVQFFSIPCQATSNDLAPPDAGAINYNKLTCCGKQRPHSITCCFLSQLPPSKFLIGGCCRGWSYLLRFRMQTMFLVLCVVIILWSDIIIVIVTRKERVRKAGKALGKDEKGIERGSGLVFAVKTWW